MDQESFSRNAPDFKKIECQLDEEEKTRLVNAYQGKMIVDGVTSDAVVDEHDVRCLWYRMKLVRDHVKFSSEKGCMLKRYHNYIIGMGDKVCYRALRGLYPVISILVAEENLKALTERMNKFAIDESRSFLGMRILVTTKAMFSTIVGLPLNSVQLMGCLVNLPAKYPMPFDLVSSLPPKLNVDSLLDGSAIIPIRPPILLLDDVRSADNVGVLFRSAFSFGISSAILTSTSSSALNARSARVSMGALYHFTFYETDDLPKVIRRLVEQGIAVYGTTPNTDSIVSTHKDSNWALLVGNEADGAADATLDACDRLVKIPQLAGDSLSVSHAAAICLYELNRDVLQASSFQADLE